MKIVVWSEMPVLAHMGIRTHYLLPAALGKLGHEVYYCPSTSETDIPFVPDYMKNHVLPYIKIVSPKDFYDIFPTDIFIYIFTVPSKNEEPERKFFESLRVIRKLTTHFVYYCPGLWKGWLPHFPIEEGEGKIIEHSTHIFAISPQLCVYLSRRYNREVYLLPNAIPPWFNPHPLPKENRHQIGLIVGSAHLQDVNDVLTLAKAFPSWDFYWVGGFDQDKGPLGHSPLGNLFILKDKFPHEVSSIAHASLVGIVPAGRNWFSYFNDPTKWYIYHGCGLPIISRGIPHHTYTPFYPHTFVCRKLTEGFQAFLSSLHNIHYPLTPLPIHSYEHRASTFIEVVEGISSGYGKSEQTFTDWRDVYRAAGKSNPTV